MPAYGVSVGDVGNEIAGSDAIHVVGAWACNGRKYKRIRLSYAVTFT